MSTTTLTTQPAFTIDGDTLHIPAWEMSLPIAPLLSPQEARRCHMRLILHGDVDEYHAAILRDTQLFGIPCVVGRLYWGTGEPEDGFTLHLASETVGMQIERAADGLCTYRACWLQGVHKRGWIERGTATMTELLPLVLRLAHGEGGDA